MGVNMAFVTYLEGALQQMKNLPADEVKVLAFEFATGAIHGISTSGNEQYSITKLPGKTFTGFQYLAWYYVAWALHNPSMLDKLGLPYEEERKLANRS
jgi:hypothetical protein